MQREIWRHFDFWLLGAVAVLTIFGIAMIRSAAAGNVEILANYPRQIYFALAGFAIILIVSYFDYHLLSAVSRVLYVLVAVLLIFIWLAGTVQGGAARWLNIGFILIQPSELAKIATILVVAGYFSRAQNRPHDLMWVARSLLPVLGLVIPVFLQPNLSTSITIMVIWVAMLWAAGLEWKYIALFAGVAILMGVIGFPFLEDYQKERVFTFLFPNPDARYGNTYNVIQALISIGSGGLLGAGYGQGSQVQLRFLKVRHTDFIFSATAEEFGFVGAVVILALMGFVIYRCLRAAYLARDTYGALICYGVAAYLFFHTIMNIGMNMNMIPVTGLPLPFLSYGGSALLTSLLAIGLVESVILRHRSLEFSG